MKTGSLIRALDRMHSLTFYKVNKYNIALSPQLRPSSTADCKKIQYSLALYIKITSTQGEWSLVGHPWSMYAYWTVN